ncbi:MAG: hypothetical protein HQ549_02525 [Candidatus Omnitrophica bacterium]|nr:hypothetical protein [Candidatus Omnitrophota bacterium]
MGKFLGVTIGVVVAFIGLVLLIAWWYEFLFILRGVIPVLLIFGGGIALIAGLSELKDTLKAKKE